MSKIEKLIIPLIDDCVTMKEISSENFIGVFTEDINSPGLDYIFLVYEYDMSNLHLSLKNGIDCVRRIGDKLVHIIKFPIYSPDLKHILKGEYNLLSNGAISKIYTFWKDFDSETANFPFYKTLVGEKYYRCIPEEKFVSLKRKPEGFTVPQ